MAVEAVTDGPQLASAVVQAHARGLWPAAIQPHVAIVCRFYSICLCNPCKYYSFTDPPEIEGWVGFVGWPIVDSLSAKWSPVNVFNGCCYNYPLGGAVHSIHQIPSVPIVDCYQKIRQQVKCYLQMAGVMGKNELQEVSLSFEILGHNFAYEIVSNFSTQLCSWWPLCLYRGAREPFFQQGRAVELKNQVLSCNMIRWFSAHPLKSCWLLMHYNGEGTR